MCNKLPIENFELLTITMVAGQTVYQFPNDSTINNAKEIDALRAYYSFTGTMKDPNGATLIDAATFRSAYLVVSDNNSKQPINKIPLTEIAMMPNTQNPADFLLLKLNGVNASKCQVVLGDTATLVAGNVLLIGIVYKN